MVEQFADPYACLRELVQNALDAETSRIDVGFSAHREGRDTAALAISVRDDGQGMSLDVVERCLLVLFRSSKDGDRRKIGKFGVGFFSVFALKPQAVTVETGTGPNHDAVKLSLAPDFSYEIIAAPPRRGTVVTLQLALPTASLRGVVEQSLASLKRWCPHVDVALVARVEGVDADTDGERTLNTPFSYEHPVQVEGLDADGNQHILALEAAGGAAFYNRGILLYETHESLVGSTYWKVNASGLHHTVSRDGVRRDATFERVVAHARQYARSALKPRAELAFEQYARRCVEARRREGRDVEAARTLRKIALVAAQGSLALNPDALAWPLTDPVAALGGDGCTARFKRSWLGDAPLASDGPNLLTGLVAAEGVAVIDLMAAGVEGQSALTELYFSVFGDKAQRVTARYTAATRAEAAPPGSPRAALREAVASLLKQVEVAGVAWVLWSGRDAERLSAPMPGPIEAPSVLLPDKGRGGLKGQWLWVWAEHPSVLGAERLASEALWLAALALAKQLLLDADALDARRDHALQQWAILGDHTP